MKGMGEDVKPDTGLHNRRFPVDFGGRKRLFHVSGTIMPPQTKEPIVKYLCLVYVEEQVLNGLPKPERQSLSDESMAFCNDLQKKGQLIAASPLHPVETATTVRVRSGNTATTDGPFAETKEQLGGFLAIDVRDLNDAIRIAAHFPAARIGSIEVRPMKELGCAE
jgi:hypothetical protein